MRNIAIIPARSGSKGLKDKNIKELNGKPLLAYSIEAAIESSMFETVMVSTDSKEYADIAKEYGAEVPFLRSIGAASDTSSSWDVVREVLFNYGNMKKTFDSFMLLQPTSPLRTADDIRNAYRELERKEALSIVSVCETDHSPLQAGTLPHDLSLDSFVSDCAKGKRRQDLETFYRFNGAIYLSMVESFLKTGDIYAEKCFAYIMDKRASVDIDDDYDFIIAEALLNYNNVRY